MLRPKKLEIGEKNVKTEKEPIKTKQLIRQTRLS
jgi:hypothetical protein